MRPPEDGSEVGFGYFDGKGKVDIDVQAGGNQIKYEDQDPIVPKMFQQACAKAGVKNLMEKHYRKFV